MRLLKKSAWVLAILIFSVSVLYVITTFVRYGEHYLNADISSDLVMGQFLNEEKTFISKNFYYSTEIKIANAVNIYQVMLALFPDNWHMARLGAIIVNMTIFAIGFMYMVKAFAADIPAMLICFAAIVLPFSSDYMFLMTFGCCSQIYMAATFFDIGVILRNNNDKRSFFRLIVLALINLVVSSSGLKMVMFSAMPAVVVCVYFLCSVLTKIQRVSDIIKMPEWPVIIGGVINGISIGVGYAFNQIYIIPNYHVDNFMSSTLRHFSFADVLIHIQYIPEFLGFVGEVPMASVTGVASIITVILFIFLISILLTLFRESLQIDFALARRNDYICDVKHAIQDGSKEQIKGNRGVLTIPERFVIVFCVASLFFGLLINVSTPKGRNAGSLGVGYYLSGFLMLIIIGFIFFTKIACKQRWVTYVFISSLYLIFLGKAYATVRDNMQSSDSHYEQTADWLVENGYTEGFATYWNGNVLSEASDGKIEVWALWNLEDSQIYRWLQKVSHSTVYPKGKCFVYATSMQVWDQDVDIDFMESIAERSIVLPNDDRLYLFGSGDEYMSHFD